jgi:hypothetical protein
MIPIETEDVIDHGSVPHVHMIARFQLVRLEGLSLISLKYESRPHMTKVSPLAGR